MASNLFEVIKSPNPDTTYTNIAYFAPGTFPEHVKNVEVTNPIKKKTYVFTVELTSTVNPGKIALSLLQRNDLFAFVNEKVSVNPILVDNYAFSIIAYVKYINREHADKKKIIPLIANTIKQEFVTRFNGIVVNADQKLPLRIKIIEAPVEMFGILEINIHFILAENHTPFDHAYVNQNTNIHLLFDDSLIVK